VLTEAIIADMISISPASVMEKAALFVLYVVMLYLYIMSLSIVHNTAQYGVLEFPNIIGY